MSWVALLLPVLPGVALWIALLGRPRDVATWCAALGVGALLGWIGTGVLLALAEGGPARSLFSRSAPWIGGLSTVALVLAWWRAPSTTLHATAAPRGMPGMAVWPALLLALILLAIGLQASALPTLAWDAWNAWLAKTQAWYHADRIGPAVGTSDWWLQAPGSGVAVAAAHYPDALPRLALWVASTEGIWQSGTVHRLWPLLWLALASAYAGLLRIQGVASGLALWSTLGLMSLPLLDAHAALAGYADLWVAALVLVAGVFAQRWSDRRRWRDLSMFLVCLVLLPALKLEGSIWAGCLVAGTAVAALPARWRLAAPLALLVALAVGLALGGFSLPLPGLGMVQLRWGELVVPGMAPMVLTWRPVAGQVAQTLWLLPNWGVLWFIAPSFALLFARCWWRRAGLRSLALTQGFGAAFLSVLFFLTDASAWAENLTSVNRVLLQMVPLTAYWLTLLWVESGAPRDTATPTSG